MKQCWAINRVTDTILLILRNLLVRYKDYPIVIFKQIHSMSCSLWHGMLDSLWIE